MKVLSLPFRWLLAIPLLLAVGLVVMGAVLSFNGIAAGTWDQSEATIKRSGRDLTYQFTAEGEQATGHTLRHSFLMPTDEEIEQRYPPGAVVTVRHASSDGLRLSVLEPGFHWDTAMIAVVSLWVMVACWKRMKPAHGVHKP